MLAGRGRGGGIRLTLGAPALLLMLLLAGPDWGANICFPDALPSLLRLSVEDQPNTQATLNAYLYALDSSSGQREVVPISGGLLLVSWGDYPTHVCRMVTGKDGKVSAIFSNKPSDYPGGGESRTYTVTFCPFTAYNDDVSKPNSVWMANCARFKDSGTGKAITRLNYETVSVCPGAPDNGVKEFQITTPTVPETHDLGDLWQPSTSFLTLRNNSPTAASATFCWGLAAVFGLLFSAMFITGRNPLSFLDWGATRNVRVNRAAGFYIPMSQNVSVAPVSILTALDRGAGMIVSKSELTESQSDFDDANAENDKVQADPKATDAQKKAATTRLENAQTKLGAATELVQARKELKEASSDTRLARDTGGRIARAEQGVKDASKSYASATKNFNLVSGQAPRSMHVGDARMQTISQQGPVSSWVNRQIGLGLDKVNVFETDKEKDGRSLLSNLGNTLIEGMVRTVGLAVPGMVMGRGKFGLKRAAAALDYSAKHQARAIAKEELVTLVQAGANVVAPLLVHGIPNTPDSLEWQGAKKEVEEAEKNLERKESVLGPLFGQTPDYIKQPDDVKIAQQRYETAQAKFAKVSELYNQAFSNASSSVGGLTNGMMNPLFELMADKWFGSEQPPRLQAMSGAGALLGLSISDYLFNPSKFDPLALQRQLDALRQMRSQK